MKFANCQKFRDEDKTNSEETFSGKRHLPFSHPTLSSPVYALFVLFLNQFLHTAEDGTFDPDLC